MGRITVALMSAGFAVAVAGAAKADSYYDLEHARANARAGGPVSEYDAELLERYGAYSGTPDWRVRGRSKSVYYDREGEAYRPLHRKVRRHHRDD